MGGLLRQGPEVLHSTVYMHVNSATSAVVRGIPKVTCEGPATCLSVLEARPCTKILAVQSGGGNALSIGSELHNYFSSSSVLRKQVIVNWSKALLYDEYATIVRRLELL